MFDADIDDLKYYNDEMKKSLLDKAFFLDKVDADIFVDYGCGDGSLLQFIEEMFPDIICVGYDISSIELDVAGIKTDAALFSDWPSLLSHLSVIRGNKKVAVICNSVMHEVYSYGNEDSIAEFWGQIFGDTFDTVIIRDMCINAAANRASDPVTVAKIRQNYSPTRIAEYESIWPTLDNNHSLLHFLLKYRYEKNWQREVEENYLPIDFENMLFSIPAEFVPVHVDHYTLPFLRQQVQKDFGFDLAERTHIKLILEKKQ